MSESTIDKAALLEQANELKEILELIPNDISTLNSLILTYLQAELTQQAAEYAMQMRQALIASNDEDLLEHYGNTYRKYSNNDPLILDIFATQSTTIPKNNENINQITSPISSIPNYRDTNESQTLETNILDELTMQLNRELEFAEYLKREDIINAEQCDKAIEQVITDSSNLHSRQPLTILQQLSTLEHINMPGIIAKISHKTSVPFIEISRFKRMSSLEKKVNMLKAQRLGFAIFSEFEGELMIACLNPIDSQLKYTLRELLNTNLHFYITTPNEIYNFYNN
ncbi:MAG: hypothetical protein ACRC37_00900 [Lentisphaeria bacterium]